MPCSIFGRRRWDVFGSAPAVQLRTQICRRQPDTRPGVLLVFQFVVHEIFAEVDVYAANHLFDGHGRLYRLIIFHEILSKHFEPSLVAAWHFVRLQWAKAINESRKRLA